MCFGCNLTAIVIPFFHVVPKTGSTLGQSAADRPVAETKVVKFSRLTADIASLAVEWLISH